MPSSLCSGQNSLYSNPMCIGTYSYHLTAHWNNCGQHLQVRMKSPLMWPSCCSCFKMTITTAELGCKYVPSVYTSPKKLQTTEGLPCNALGKKNKQKLWIVFWATWNQKVLDRNNRAPGQTGCPRVLLTVISYWFRLRSPRVNDLISKDHLKE